MCVWARTDVASAREQLSSASDRSRPSTARKPGRPQGNATSLSLVARAISLLIQYPALNTSAGFRIRALKGFEIPGLELLMEISRLLDESPDLATGALVERFRDTPNQVALEKLAVQHHLITNQALLEPEFGQILVSLNAQFIDQQRNQLLEQLSSGQITEEEAATQLITLDNQRRKK